MMGYCLALSDWLIGYILTSSEQYFSYIQNDYLFD
jgi:hypothetical protein